jgi:hypothetical protein
MDCLKIEEAQKRLCGRYGAAFVSTPPDDKIGFATATAGLEPINGTLSFDLSLSLEVIRLSIRDAIL